MQLSSHPAAPVDDRSSDPSPCRKSTAKLENPNAKYLVGWSRGKETLKSGRYDTLKGSYYVNCAAASSQPSTPSEREYPDFPEYTAPNVWPDEAVLPGFKQCFEELCLLVIDTAVLVARACDRFGVQSVEGYEAGYLERIVATSTTTKARLLHYFPNPLSSDNLPNGSHITDDSAEDDDDDNDDWCATHTDHGCLTGLTSAMYIDETTIPTPTTTPPATTPPHLPPLPLSELPATPDPAAGLYIHTRTGQVAQVRIPRDSLAFQTGKALQVMTRGKFKAVPHFVRGSRGRVARNTLAVFTQPNLGEVVDRERGVDFAGFAKGVVGRGV